MKKVERLDPLIVASALVLSEQQQKEVSLTKNVIIDNLLMIGAQMRPVLPMFSDVVQRMNVPVEQCISVKHLFSAFGPLAAKCREIATLNYILDSDTEKYEKAQSRLKELFDCSEHFCTEEDSYAKQKQLNDTIASMIELIRYCKQKDPDFQFIELNDTYSYIVHGQRVGARDFKTKFTNQYGISFEVSSNGIEYFHPNEFATAVTRYAVFKGDLELILDYFNKLFEHYNFILSNYTEEAEANEHSGLFGLIYRFISTVDEKREGHRSIDLDGGRLQIEYIKEQGRENEVPSYFLILRTSEVNLAMRVHHRPSGIVIQYQNHTYSCFKGWDHVSTMSRQIKMKELFTYLYTIKDFDRAGS